MMKKWSRHLLAAGALALGMSAAHADDNNTLYFYNWTEYVPPGLLEQFTKETGIKVIDSSLRVERDHVRQAQNLQRRRLRPGGSVHLLRR